MQFSALLAKREGRSSKNEVDLPPALISLEFYHSWGVVSDSVLHSLACQEGLFLRLSSSGLWRLFMPAITVGIFPGLRIFTTPSSSSAAAAVPHSHYNPFPYERKKDLESKEIYASVPVFQVFSLGLKEEESTLINFQLPPLLAGTALLALSTLVTAVAAPVVSDAGIGRLYLIVI